MNPLVLVLDASRPHHHETLNISTNPIGPLGGWWVLHAKLYLNPADLFAQVDQNMTDEVTATMLVDIRHAARECSERGLMAASKWYTSTSYL
jgi:hypothetical protein